MNEICMFDILALPENDLKKVLSKASTRSLAKLVAAYPRAVGHTFLNILTQCLSAPTIAFLREEICVMHIPSFAEIRNAESELLKIIHEEHLVETVSSAQRARSLPR